MICEEIWIGKTFCLTSLELATGRLKHAWWKSLTNPNCQSVCVLFPQNDLSVFIRLQCKLQIEHVHRNWKRKLGNCFDLADWKSKDVGLESKVFFERRKVIKFKLIFICLKFYKTNDEKLSQPLILNTSRPNSIILQINSNFHWIRIILIFAHKLFGN